MNNNMTNVVNGKANGFMRRILIGVLMIMCMFVCVAVVKVDAFAKPIDEIQVYQIVVDVNDDASLDMKYHIEWLVLDSSSAVGGPVDWVRIGIPNTHATDFVALSDNISSVYKTTEGGDVFARVDFKKKYSAGEVISFDFKFTQDYMYQIETTRGIKEVQLKFISSS